MYCGFNICMWIDPPILKLQKKVMGLTKITSYPKPPRPTTLRSALSANTFTVIFCSYGSWKRIFRVVGWRLTEVPSWCSASATVRIFRVTPRQKAATSMARLAKESEAFSPEIGSVWWHCSVVSVCAKTTMLLLDH